LPTTHTPRTYTDSRYINFEKFALEKLARKCCDKSSSTMVLKSTDGRVVHCSPTSDDAHTPTA
jgi:hypothetical protein